MPRTSSSAAYSTADHSVIATIYVSGHPAYGSQICRRCGQGWPWVVFRRKSDGNRDHEESTCLRCLDPPTESIRWGMHRNEMQRYIQLARKQIKADGVDSHVPTVLLGKEKDLGLKDLQPVQARLLQDTGPLGSHHPPTHTYHHSGPRVHSVPNIHPPPLSTAVNTTIQQSTDTAPAAEAQRRQQQSRQDMHKQLHDDAVQAARLATVRATQEAAKAAQLRLASALSKQAAVHQHEQEDRDRLQSAQQRTDTDRIASAATSAERTQQPRQRQAQEATSRGGMDEGDVVKHRGLEAEQAAKASIMSRLASFHGSAQLLGLDVKAEAMLPLHGAGRGWTRVGVTNEEMGFVLLPEPLRTKTWIQLHYTLAPSTSTALIGQADMYHFYNNTVKSLSARIAPIAQPLLAINIKPIPAGRDFVSIVQQTWPEVGLQKGQSLDGNGAPVGRQVFCFSRLAQRTHVSLATLPQAQHRAQAEEPQRIDGTAQRTEQHPVQHAQHAESLEVPGITKEMALYVQTLPSIAPAVSSNLLDTPREIARIWHALGKPYRPHGPGTYGQRYVGPQGYICVLDDDRITLWQGPSGDVQQRAVYRNNGRPQVSSTGPASAVSTAAGSAVAQRGMGPNSGSGVGEASREGKGRMGLAPDVVIPIRSRTGSSEIMPVDASAAEPIGHGSTVAAPASTAPANLAASTAASGTPTVIAPRFSTGSASSPMHTGGVSDARPGENSASRGAGVRGEVPVVRAPSFGGIGQPTEGGQARTIPPSEASGASQQSKGAVHAPVVRAPVFSMVLSQKSNTASSPQVRPMQPGQASSLTSDVLASGPAGNTSGLSASAPGVATLASKDLGPTITGKGLQIIELDTSHFKKRKRSELEASDDADTHNAGRIANPFDLTGALPTAATSSSSTVLSSAVGAGTSTEWDVLQRRSTALAPGGESTIVTPSAEVLRRAGVTVGMGDEDDEQDRADMDMVVDLISEDVTRE